MGIWKKIQEFRQDRRQKAFIQQKPPLFIHTPSFPRLTYQQRKLLFKLVDLTISKGTYMGEFWWRSDPDDTNIVTQIKPRDQEGNFDPDNPMFQDADWDWVAEQAQMEALDRYGYLVISEEHEYGSKKEKWRHFAVAQIGFDLFSHAHNSFFHRGIRFIWEKTENHLLALFFGMVGALLVELLLFIVQD